MTSSPKASAAVFPPGSEGKEPNKAAGGITWCRTAQRGIPGPKVRCSIMIFEEVSLGGFASVFLLLKCGERGSFPGNEPVYDKVGISSGFQQSPKTKPTLFCRELSRLPNTP